MEQKSTPDPRILNAVFLAVDEVNRTLPESRRLARTVDTPLAESQGGLDSLGLVNLIVALEEHIEAEFGATINLADQRAVTAEQNPLSTLGTLAMYVEQLLQEQTNA